MQIKPKEIHMQSQEAEENTHQETDKNRKKNTPESSLCSLLRKSLFIALPLNEEFRLRLLR